MILRRVSTKTVLIIAAVGLLVLGTWGYAVVEDMDPFHALYFLIISVTTVGYGDMYPTTIPGRILTLFVVPVGILVVFGLGVSLSADVLWDLMLRGGAGRIERRVKSLRDHFIVCGYGRLGQEVVDSLKRMKGPVVVIDLELERLRGLEEEGVLYIVGDALEEGTLVRAGIDRARCVITTFSDDTRNVYLTLEAREIESDVTVISSASGREARRRLYLAGASRVVSPQILVGDILAKSAHNPYIYQLMSDMMSGDAPGETITQIVVSEGSDLSGKCLHDFQELGVSARVVLIRHEDETVLSPSGEFCLEAGMVLVVVGRTEELNRLDRMASS